MAPTKQKELDPKLRRLVSTLSRSDRLRAEMDRGIVIASEAVGEDELPSAEQLSKRVLVRLIGDRPPSGLDDLTWHRLVEGIWSVAVPLDRLQDLATRSEVEYVEAGRPLVPMLSTSLPETGTPEVHSPPGGGTGLRGAGVAVGIIDLGFDFTLDDFRNPDGTTRVAFFWDQFLEPAGGESPPVDFGYGVEYDRAAIDAALGANDPFSEVRHRPQAGSHGTHVAGIAVGNGRSGDDGFPAGDFVGVAPEATIIFVQPASNDAQTTFADSVHVTEAIAYVFARAAELGLPCVINMSLGQNGGSHDGENLVERAIDRLLDTPGRAMVVAAGNEHIWRGHAGGSFPEAQGGGVLPDGGSNRSLRWKVGGRMPLPGGGTLAPGFGDFTPNEMEIWYSSRDRLAVRVQAPTGEVSSRVEPGETVDETVGDGRLFIDSERFSVLNGDSRIYLELAPLGATPLPEGEWTVELEPLELRENGFDAWIERDVRRSNNSFADQSFFAGTDFDPRKTLGTPATTRRGITCANYDHVAQAPNDSSSRGRTRDGRTKPEVAAPGTRILSSNALGGRPDGNGGSHPVRVSKTGTSMSAPHVSGVVALMLQANPRLASEQIRKMLIAGTAEPPGVTPFDDAWGYGRVDCRTATELAQG